MLRVGVLLCGAALVVVDGGVVEEEEAGGRAVALWMRRYGWRVRLVDATLDKHSAADSPTMSLMRAASSLVFTMLHGQHVASRYF